MPDVPVIAVDGPSGTGKGTICSYLADWLQWHFLDSGALYRVLVLAAEKHSIAIDDAEALAMLACKLDAVFTSPGAGQEVEVFLEGENVSADLRTETCGSNASRAAALPQVRLALLDRQRAFRTFPGLVADGRDMGTVVFPDAILKIYLTASADERAKRRHKQLKQKGIDATLRQLSTEIAERDIRDSRRTVSPLIPAEDAVVIDTTGLKIEAVTDRISNVVCEIIPGASKLSGQT
ncbi:MAG: (d)CMP kinase [Gammaproteobacteria bacterium]